MRESDIQRQIQLHWTALGHRLFRNNVGMAVAANGTLIRYGLCTGSSDLIGFKVIEISNWMVGHKFAQFAAVEVKSQRGRLTTEQRQFLDMVAENGGHAVCARSVEESL